MLQAHSSQTAMYLYPKDLLQLSRLLKQFRSMFASLSALFVWKTVSRKCNLYCFRDLNEIQFASLLYDKCCMVNFSPFCTISIILYDSFFIYTMLPSGMRTFHEMHGILCASSEIVSMLSNCEVIFFIFF